MKITAITAQLKSPNRVNIFVDGTYRLSLDVFQVADLGVRIDKEYTDSEMRELESESQFGKMYAVALEYCLMRPHSSREVREYLFRKTRDTKRRNKRTGEVSIHKGISLTVADRVYERLAQKKYIDDEKFARYWVENRNLIKGVSKRKLQYELKSKGISEQIIRDSLIAGDRSDENELQKVIDKKRKRYPDNQKFTAYLARQGFLYDDIRRELNKGE